MVPGTVELAVAGGGAEQGLGAAFRGLDGGAVRGSGFQRTRRGQFAAPVRSRTCTGEPARSRARAVSRNRSSLVEVTSSPPGASSTLWIRSISVLPDCCGAITPVAFSNGSHRSCPVTGRLMQRNADLRQRGLARRCGGSGPAG